MPPIISPFLSPLSSSPPFSSIPIFYSNFHGDTPKLAPSLPQTAAPATHSSLLCWGPFLHPLRGCPSPLGPWGCLLQRRWRGEAALHQPPSLKQKAGPGQLNFHSLTKLCLGNIAALRQTTAGATGSVGCKQSPPFGAPWGSFCEPQSLDPSWARTPPQWAPTALWNAMATPILCNLDSRRRQKNRWPTGRSKGNGGPRNSQGTAPFLAPKWTPWGRFSGSPRRRHKPTFLRIKRDQMRIE